MPTPSKRKPTSKELGHLARIYAPLGQLVVGKNGGVWVSRTRRVKPL